MKRRAVKGLVQLMRPACPECSGSLEWMGMGEACDTLGFDQVNAFLGFLGGAMLSDDVELDFWRCRKCGESGVLAGPEVA